MTLGLRSVVGTAAISLIVAAALLACRGQEYTLIFRNESTNTGVVCVYQHDPEMDVQDVKSVAWFAKGAAPTTILRFRWTLGYCFVWSETGRLGPGAVFKAEQRWEVEEWTTDNRVTFEMLPGGIYTFADQTAGPDNEALYIIGDETLPRREASVGIGMAGAATYVVPAQPNTAWIFTPKPQYWITFGSFEPGEVLDVESITWKEEVIFPEGVFSMTAVLHRNNTWTVFPTSDSNAL